LKPVTSKKRRVAQIRHRRRNRFWTSSRLRKVCCRPWAEIDGQAICRKNSCGFSLTVIVH